MTKLQIPEKLENLIYEVRGQQVMLDSDVARLYGYETKAVNQTVKRNIERFPERYCFQLTEEELDSLRSQFVTLDKTVSKRGSNIKYLPYVFTEHGITMLAGLLKSDKAVKMSLKIIDAFVEMRRFIMNNINVLERLNHHELKFIEYDDNFNKIFNKLSEPELTPVMFYGGEVYDAYSLLIDILGKAKKRIVIIDNYIDKTILDMLRHKYKEVDVTIITSEEKNHLDVKRFIKQNPKIKLKLSKGLHDRFIIIDDKVLYHVGSSLKDIGKSLGAINEIADQDILDNLLIKINSL